MATEAEVKAAEVVLRRWATSYGIANFIAEEKYESLAVDIVMAAEAARKEDER